MDKKHQKPQFLTNLLLNNNSKYEQLHNKFCKQALGIHSNATNLASKIELGRFPLELSITVSTLKYIIRLMGKPKDSLCYQALQSQIELNNHSKMSLVGYIEYVTSELQFNIDKNDLLCKSKVKRLVYTFSQQLKQYFHTAVYNIRDNNNIEQGMLHNYFEVKRNMGLENYLRVIKNPKWRSAITKLRLSAHNLPVQSGRYSQIPRAQRICKICNDGQVGDELHLLFNCKQSDIVIERQLLLYNIYKAIPQLEDQPLIFQFKYLLQCSDESIMIGLGKFLSKAFEIMKLNKI